DRFVARGAKRVRAFSLGRRNGLQHFTRDRRGEWNDHHRQNHRCRQHAEAERWSREERPLAHRVWQRGLERSHPRHHDENAPEAVDDRRNRGEELGQEHERLPQDVRTQLGDEHGDADRDWRREDQCEDRRVESAPDERQRAKVADDRVPGFGAPEVEPELANRRHRLLHEHEADAAHNDNEDERKRARPQSETQIPRTLSHEVLILASAAISSLTTSAGSGAYPRSAQYFWPSVNAHLTKSTIVFAIALSFGFSYSSSHVNDEIGYTPLPGAFVIDTRKSAGICFTASAAAAVTDSTDAFTSSPAAFLTVPYLILFC